MHIHGSVLRGYVGDKMNSHEHYFNLQKMLILSGIHYKIKEIIITKLTICSLI